MRTARRTVLGLFRRLSEAHRGTTPLGDGMGGGCLALVFACGLMAMTAAVAGDYRLHRWTIDGGGVTRSTGGDLELSGTIGQPDAGPMRGGDIELAAGFWFPLEPGDCNIDGTADLVDLRALIPCLSGPAEAHPPDCTCYDLDQDGDIDLHDIAGFERSFDGG